METRREGPEWLCSLLEYKGFFEKCKAHEEEGNGKSTEKYFCIDCRQAICKLCLEPHMNDKHPILQVRKASNMESISTEDAQGIIDITEILPYKFNKGPVVFLRSRPQDTHQPGKYHCAKCERYLHKGGGMFCSIQCKFLSLDEFPEITLETNIDYEKFSNYQRLIDKVSRKKGRVKALRSTRRSINMNGPSSSSDATNNSDRFDVGSSVQQREISTQKVKQVSKQGFRVKPTHPGDLQIRRHRIKGIPIRSPFF